MNEQDSAETEGYRQLESMGKGAVALETRCILLGGFLGAGKTTTLLAAAERLTQSGHSVAIVVNDQGTELVDKELADARDLSVFEVLGGCFCCKFENMMETLQHHRVAQADFILCEPVGSCTDLTATVIRPLRSLLGSKLVLSPLTVLIDPLRLSELDSLEQDAFEVDPVNYIWWKQMEEADVLVINKTDLLSSDEVIQAVERLRRTFPDKTILSMSAFHGDDLDRLIHCWLTTTKRVDHLLKDIDYDIYAEGEARLAWLNVSGAVTKNFGSGFVPTLWVLEFLSQFKKESETKVKSIAHVKVMMTNPGGYIKASVVGTNAEIVIDRHGEIDTTNDCRIVVNARVESVPEVLEKIVDGSIQRTNQIYRTFFMNGHLESFSPSRPDPTYRMV